MRAAICLLLPLMLAGCGKTRSCKSGTVLLKVHADSASAAADSLTIQVTVDGTAGTSHSIPHTPGATEGTVEIDFSPYPRDAKIEVVVTASAGGVVIGGGSNSATLTAGCLDLPIELRAENSDGSAAADDLSIPDLAGADFAGDLAVSDMASALPFDMATVEDLKPPVDLACGCADGSICCAGGCQQASVTNCGCGAQCAPPSTHQSAAACVLSGGSYSCAYTCVNPFHDCDVATKPDTDGCETNTSNGDSQNCGACGTKCDTVTSLGALCTGGNCLYTGCASSYFDCNSAAPNTNGCECPNSTTPPDGGCCGTSCQTKHDTGILNLQLGAGAPQTESARYFDCSPKQLSGWDQNHAMRACTAWLGGSAAAAGACAKNSCSPGVDSVCAHKNVGLSDQQCACWVLDGSNAGKAFVDSSSNCSGCDAVGNLWN